MDNSKEYEVERIVGKRIENNKIEYFVKWKDFPKEFNTWEPIENLPSNFQLVEAFEDKSSKCLTFKKRSNTRDIATIDINYGNFKDDKPNKIISAEIIVNIKDDISIFKEIQFLVDWEKRKNGIKPLPSYYSNLELRKLNPNILLDFYESRLVSYDNE